MHWYSVYQTIWNIVHSVNEMFRWILELLTNNAIFTSFNSSVEVNVIVGTIKATALTLCVLFFLIDFFQKSLHLQWVTWENILMFFMKLFLAKIILNNTGVIMNTIQNGLAAMIPQETISDGLLPETLGNGTKSAKEIRKEAEDAVNQEAADGLYDEDFQAIKDELGDSGKYISALAEFLETKIQEKISGSNANGGMIGFFVPPGSDEYNKICSLSKRRNWFDFEPLLCNLKIMIQGLIIQIVVLLACIIVLARVFELVVYTSLAPIPLATLSCDGLQEVGKGFLKSFVAVCIQAIVIVVMFLVFKALIDPNTNPISLPTAVQSWGAMLYAFIFGAGVMQSGNWAKKICGAM